MGTPGRHAAYARDVYGFLAYRLGSRALAEELTRTTFERARREGWVPDSGSVRSRVALLRVARQVSDGQEAVDASAAGDLTLSAELTEALAGLSARDRMVLALYFGGSLAGMEIASVIRSDEARVRVRLSRALRRLRVVLERDERDHDQQQQA